jgi:hypothetical protein
MYPTLVEIAGGRERMIAMLRGDGGNTKRNRIIKIEVIEPRKSSLPPKNSLPSFQ